ncbi:MAG TPA: HAMP domain-containing sensor histidine kinase [Rhodocyclaceae bacterium]
MLRRHSLRFRVAFYFAGLGAVLSLLFALGLWLAAHDLSKRLIDQTLTAELDDYMARRARNPRSLPPDTASLRGYVTNGDAIPDMPPQLRGLAPGRHEIVLDGVPYRVAVAERDGERYTMIFSEERQHARESAFLFYLAGGALLMTLLAAAGGRWLAGRVVAPVADLAYAVTHAPSDNPPRLSLPDQPNDEIGELRHAFDRYLERLGAFVERERAFASDASHELRTPLAVIRGAAEVLSEDKTLGPAQAGRVARIERAAGEMAALTAALLHLAREEAAPADEACECGPLVLAAVERHRKQAENRHSAIEVQIDGPVWLDVAPALFSIVVDNLVRNAVAHTEGGTVSLHLAADRLTVGDTGCGIADGDRERVFERGYRGPASEGAGIGLSLVKRICDRQGWKIELQNATGCGTIATLLYTP